MTKTVLVKHAAVFLWLSCCVSYEHVWCWMWFIVEWHLCCNRTWCHMLQEPVPQVSNLIWSQQSILVSVLFCTVHYRKSCLHFSRQLITITHWWHYPHHAHNKTVLCQYSKFLIESNSSLVFDSIQKQFNYSKLYLPSPVDIYEEGSVS